MCLKLATCLALVGGLAACASPPPPPPPMAAVETAPAPTPPPMVAPADGIYSGTVMSTDNSRPRCRKLPAKASTRVRNGTFALQGVGGKIGADGSVTVTQLRSMTMSGTFSDATLDVTTMSRGCGYHYTLKHG